MTTLTKKQYRDLHAILSNLRRAYNYIEQPAVIGIAEAVTDPNGADFTIRNPACLESCCGLAEHIRPMNKSIGSDIAGLSQALHQLEDFLNPPTSQEGE